MKQDEVTDIRLIWPHTIIVDMPYLDTRSEDRMVQVPYAELLPKVFTTVLKAYKCSLVRAGDTVMFLPNHCLDYYTADHRRIWAMDERACQVVIEGITM